MTDALVVIDMQEGSFGPDNLPRHDFQGLIERLNKLTKWIRDRQGLVVWVQHNGSTGDALEPGTEGWQILVSLTQNPADVKVQKTYNDSFLHTGLEELLRKRGINRVIITGWATDFCVDATVRSSTARGFQTCVLSDCHTLSDRPYLTAVKIIQHHNSIWSDLITPAGPATVMTSRELLSEIYPIIS